MNIKSFLSLIIPFTGMYFVAFDRDSQTAEDQFLIKTTKKEYSQNDTIGVQYSGLPGNKLDWIAISKEAAKPNEYLDWLYTDGSIKGIMRFKPLPPGNYEARLYFNWEIGGGIYVVQARYEFLVRQ